MRTNHCIKNLLKLIFLLQENSLDDKCLEDGCSKPFLGPTINHTCYNTRVITLYTRDGTILSTNFIDNNDTGTSSLFRVEKVVDDCVTLRVLRLADGNYISTNNFITVNLKCICAIKCVVDTVVSNL